MTTVSFEDSDTFILVSELPTDKTPNTWRKLRIAVKKTEDDEFEYGMYKISMYVDSNVKTRFIGEFYSDEIENIQDMLYPVAQIKTIRYLVPKKNKIRSQEYN